MAQAIGSGREQLPVAKPAAGLVWRLVPESPRHQHHQHAANEKSDQRRDDDEQQNLAKATPNDGRDAPGLDDRGADQSAHQRV